MIEQITSLGFDLDNTLYRQGPEMNEKIQEYACRKASTLLSQPYETVRSRFDQNFSETQSGSRSLEAIGITNGREIIQEALENADIASVLKEDVRLQRMLDKLASSYKLFLITGSSKQIALGKLEAMGLLDPLVFNPTFYAESPYRREDGTAFQYVARLHNVGFDRMMFVGDREKVDIIPAKDLGIKTAIVNAASDLADIQLREIYELEKIFS